ncbi:MAG TPA: Spy/CpxP family protein refolding chaperone [Gemmatimonadaceae bacterium]|nr:Spy/CpxP family protein refolding chaperone [Gemmatimonadaceae bacterium]
MNTFSAIAIASALALSAATAGAQAARGTQPERAALEQQFRERTAEMIRTRLKLTERQMEQLQQVNVRYAPQLNRLSVQERQTRRALRTEISAGDSANQNRIGDLLETSLRVQRERLGIIESEQRELAAFLTPLQRARYLALQAQMRKRAEELTRQGGGNRSRRSDGAPGRRMQLGRPPTL